MTRKPAKTAEPKAECPKCGGYGLIIGEAGAISKCDCGYWDDLQFQHAFQKARIPARYLNKTLKEFRADKGDAVRTELKKCATSYATTFHPGEERGLILRGSTGTGKTHLAVGILVEIVRRGYTGLYCNVTDLLARLRDSYRDNSESSEGEILEQMETVDLLVFDDLGAENTTDWVRDRIYLIINRRYESAKATIITTNCDDAEMRERLGARTTSRLYEMCAPLGQFPKEDYRFSHMR